MALTISGDEQIAGALTAAERQIAADALHLAELNRRPISPLRHQFPELSAADAYEIQRLNVKRRVSDGAVVRGHKVGLSSRGMQQMMGTHEPDYRHLLSDLFLPENTPIAISIST